MRISDTIRILAVHLQCVLVGSQRVCESACTMSSQGTIDFSSTPASIQLTSRDPDFLW